jgi:hypothetical protein
MQETHHARQRSKRIIAKEKLPASERDLEQVHLFPTFPVGDKEWRCVPVSGLDVQLRNPPDLVVAEQVPLFLRLEMYAM